MNRRLSVLFLLLLVVGIIGGCGNSEKKEISLALTAPMSGDYAEYGTSFKNAIDLAVDKVNAEGGINGKKLNLVVGDSKADPKEAANIAQKFVADSSIMAVIGDFTSTAAFAGSPIYQKNGLVQLSPTSSHPDFTKGGNFIFRNIATQADEGPVVAKYAVNDLHKKKAAVIYINNDWGVVAKDNFIKGVKEAGGEVVDVEDYLPEQGKDFSAILTKIREANPDVLYLGCMYTDGALIAQQTRKMNFNIDLIGTASLYSDELLKLGGSAVEGFHMTCSFFPGDPRPEVQEFVKSYNEKYGKNPTMFAAQAYDAANMIIQALKDGATDRKSLRDKLAAIQNFPGVTGVTSFDENRNVKKEISKLVIRNGHYEPFTE